MRNRMGVVLALALVCGGIAAFLAFKFIQQPETASADSAATEVVRVAVATRNLEVGSVVGSEDVRLVDWPAASLPAGYGSSPGDLVGRGVLVPIAQSEPFLPSKLALKEAGGGLTIMIPAGMRAMSVKVDDVIGVAGFVLPGTRVDVLVTLDQTASQSEDATGVMLQNIEVLAAGQAIERDHKGEPQAVPVVTLLVDPIQGEKLALGASKGRIQLALRNTLDRAEVETPGTRTSLLLGKPRAVAAPVRRVSAPVVTGHTVEVYRGPERSTTKVEGSAPVRSSNGAGL